MTEFLDFNEMKLLQELLVPAQEDSDTDDDGVKTNTYKGLWILNFSFKRKLDGINYKE